ncbi:MAG: OmpA family protein [Saprospiraceae bacterium]|nr:OmpA family protein [Saprospiraceae bacterium]
MNSIKIILFPFFILTLLIYTGCAPFNKTKKGAIIGTAAGAGMGAVIGKASGNTALGAIIGAAVGGSAGALIGNKMDKQAREIKSAVPDAEVIRVGEGIVVEFTSSILFSFDKSTLSNQAKGNLDNLAEILNTHSDTDNEIQGHTDSKGSNSYNQNLSIQRAKAVSNYLSQKGTASHRLNIKGFGEKLPKYLNDSAEGREKNRRVEFLITANEKMKKEAVNQAGQ